MRKFKQFLSEYNFSVLMAFIGTIFFAASFIVPPLGVIDPSVLSAVGILFGFTAAVAGIKQYDTSCRMRYNKDQENNEEEI